MKRKLVNNLIHKPHAPLVSRFGRRFGAVAALALFIVMMSFSGCGSNTSTKPQVASIVFTDANGKPLTDTNGNPVQVTTLKTGTGLYLEVAVSDDPQLLGVNWSATCASSLSPGTPLPPGQTIDESCGYFTPTHTASGPVPSFATTSAGIITFYQAPAVQPNPATVTLYASSTTDPTRSSSIKLSIMP